jgi:uncharacterized protein YciI
MELNSTKRIRRAVLWLFFVTLPLSGQTNAGSAPSARYFVAFLRPDPARKPLAKDEAERIQSAHMANIHKMADDGVLISAGPFDDSPTTISGIFVFKVKSLHTAQSIAANDPTVVEHRNTIDVHAWNGPEGIGVEYFRLHKLDPSTPENMQIHPFCMFYRGPKWNDMRNERDSLLRDHERYLAQLKEQGKLGAAGAIDAPDDLLALVIFKPIPLEEAQRLLDADPAAKAGVLRIEYHRWWSSDHVLPW